MAGESRTEILAWLNELLDLNYTKIEQLGTGAAICQIIDSIYLDVPLTKVKMSAKHEYEYVQNFKVLQNAFKVHKIDKPIPVERLIKCKMQDNLEFAQWIKKYWDMHFPGGEYDAAARRKGVAVEPNPLIAPSTHGSNSLARSTQARSPTGSAGAVTSKMAAKRPTGAARGAHSSNAHGGVPDQALAVLTSQMNEMKLSVDGLEKERDFYFNKLRDIEIAISVRMEATDKSPEEEDHLKSLQTILYSTEDGFEVPDAAEGMPDEEETF